MCETFIEFFGAPGCGKTTVADKLTEIISGKGINVVKYSEYYKGVTKGAFWRIRLFLSAKDKSIISMMRYTLELLRSKKDYVKNDRKVAFFIVINYLVYKKISNEKHACVVCDEGVIQYAFSLYYDKRCEDKESLCNYLNFIHSQFPNIRYVFCEILPETNYERIRNRMDGKSRLDNLPLKAMKDIILIQMENAKLVAGCMKDNELLKIITRDSPYKLAEVVFNSFL